MIATLESAPGTSAQSQDMTGETSFRIAVFSYGLPCRGKKYGGIEQVAHDLANALSDRDHRVTVFTYAPRPAGACYEVARLPFKGFVETWLGRRLTMGYLGNCFALVPGYHEFDVVIAHGDSLLLPLCRRPVIRIMHGSALGEARSATSWGRAILQLGVYVQELLTALLLRNTIGVSVNSSRYNPFIRTVISNGVDLTRFRPDPSVRSEHPTILFVGDLPGRKRGAWLREQFTRVIQPLHPVAELHLVSRRGRPVPGVVYHEGISTEELVRLYQRAWIYASPSTYEGFGLPYVEALACGTPIVATPNPGSLEVLEHGRFGCLVEDDEFAATVARLLGDEAERQRLAISGLERAAAYGIARSAALYEQLIQAVVNRDG